MKVASETVRLGEQYLARANESLTSATPTGTYTSHKTVSFADLGPELDAFLTGIQSEIRESDSIAAAKSYSNIHDDTGDMKNEGTKFPPIASSGEETIEPSVWSFLRDE